MKRNNRILELEKRVMIELTAASNITDLHNIEKALVKEIQADRQIFGDDVISFVFTDTAASEAEAEKWAKYQTLRNGYYAANHEAKLVLLGSYTEIEKKTQHHSYDAAALQAITAVFKQAGRVKGHRGKRLLKYIDQRYAVLGRHIAYAMRGNLALDSLPTEDGEKCIYSSVVLDLQAHSAQREKLDARRLTLVVSDIHPTEQRAISFTGEKKVLTASIDPRNDLKFTPKFLHRIDETTMPFLQMVAEVLESTPFLWNRDPKKVHHQLALNYGWQLTIVSSNLSKPDEHRFEILCIR